RFLAPRLWDRAVVGDEAVARHGIDPRGLQPLDELVLEGAPDTRLRADVDNLDLLEARGRGQLGIAPLVDHLRRRAASGGKRQKHGDGKSPGAHSVVFLAQVYGVYPRRFAASFAS